MLMLASCCIPFCSACAMVSCGPDGAVSRPRQRVFVELRSAGWPCIAGACPEDGNQLPTGCVRQCLLGRRGTGGLRRKKRAAKTGGAGDCEMCNQWLLTHGQFQPYISLSMAGASRSPQRRRELTMSKQPLIAHLTVAGAAVFAAVLLAPAAGAQAPQKTLPDAPSGQLIAVLGQAPAMQGQPQTATPQTPAASAATAPSGPQLTIAQAEQMAIQHNPNISIARLLAPSGRSSSGNCASASAPHAEQAALGAFRLNERRQFQREKDAKLPNLIVNNANHDRVWSPDWCVRSFTKHPYSAATKSIWPIFLCVPVIGECEVLVP